MGRLGPGLVATLLILIPGLRKSCLIETAPNLSVHLLEYLPSFVCSFGCDVAVIWLLYWLFLLGFLISKFYNSRTPPKKKRTGSRNQKVRRFRRKKLAFFMVLRCRERLFSFPPITFAEGFQLQADQLGLSRPGTPLDRQHRCWRKAQAKSKHRAWRHRVEEHEECLTPGESSAC